MPRRLFVHHPDVLLHDTGSGHPERAARVGSILEHLEETGAFEEWERAEAQEVDPGDLGRVHEAGYLKLVEEVIERAPALLCESDTVVSAGSLRAARLAAGGVVGAVAEVMSGECDRAFVAVRPPGHHAERDQAMGFCLYNNVAVAAAALRARLGAARVAIVDFDVHHGNGTQHLFERDPSVFYASLHQYPHYPGTGAAGELGLEEGEGATLNCPLAAETGDVEWSVAMEDKVLPALEAFAPDFLLVSAGFDAHEADPLSSTRLREETYERFGRRFREFADRHCGGRLVSVLEGGYDLGALSRSVGAYLRGLH